VRCTIRVKNICAPHHARLAAWPACSLIGPETLPVPQEKFPVFVLREIAPYPLIYMWKSRDWARMLRQNWRSSLYFPTEQGMGVRDGFADRQ
jgi:hypothetical protein